MSFILKNIIKIWPSLAETLSLGKNAPLHNICCSMLQKCIVCMIK